MVRKVVGILLGAASLALAQLDASALANLPACAQNVALVGLASSGCTPLNNIPCICASTAFVDAITTKVRETCSEEDIGRALLVGQQICAAEGVSFPPGPSTSAPSAPAPSSSQSDFVSPTVTQPGTDSVSTITTAADTITMTTSWPATDATMTDTNANSTSDVWVTTTCTTTTMMMPSQTGPATWTGGVVEETVPRLAVLGALGIAALL